MWARDSLNTPSLSKLKSLVIRFNSFSRIFRWALILPLFIAYFHILFFYSSPEIGIYEEELSKDSISSHRGYPTELFYNLNSPISARSVRLPNPLKRPKNATKVKNSRVFSRFRCTGDDNDRHSHVERICVFENVCYNREDDRIEYYVRPDTYRKAIFFDSKRGEIFEFYNEEEGFIALVPVYHREDKWETSWKTWGPNVTAHRSPVDVSPDTTLVLKTPHALFSHWSDKDILGHVLWDEIATLWYSMIRLNILTDDLVPMHFPSSLPQRDRSKKFRDAFFPAISNIAPVNFTEYISNQVVDSGMQDVKHVCFDQLMAGGSMHHFFHIHSWHSFGHEFLFYSLRNRILASFGFSRNPASKKSPTKHRIILTNKTESINGIYKRNIHNLKELSKHIKSKFYGKNIEVMIVEWQHMTIKDQLELLQETTILVTPCGGVSAIIPFLPEGAHAIIMDYYGHNEHNYHGTKNDETVSMDSPFWNYWPHIKKSYYQISGPGDLISDDPSKPVSELFNWRDSTSVVVDFNRMDSLLEGAFEDMAG